ncbi:MULTISPECIES: ankyrin repeat domain-containing protein [unclassified Helicobacter]|uniref:ankyrin repeat domain-containing protein n=1 Tax=unclassified Helicobacter TaxID=2593540 RepID=UPI000CF0EBF4|nr:MULTISPECIES: ankyrin repeat domain-containing protein [unclassified Helicobacter]
MKKLLFFFLFPYLVLANQYDSLLFSNNYTDVRKGIDLGANVNAVLRGSTPIYDASRKNNVEILYLLINRGADVNKICHGETPLHKVVQFGNQKFAQALLKAGAKPNIKDSIRGNTPLHYAVGRNDKAMIALLMNYGADMYIENNMGDVPARFVFSKVQIPAMRVQNKQITLASSAFSLSQGAVGVSISNSTNTFITITTVALYVNGNLISEIEVNKSLAPRSSSGIGSLPITREAYKSVSLSRNGNAKVKYGFAVKYTIDGSSKTLYETTKTDLKVW